MSVHGLRTLLLGGVGGAGGVLLSRYVLPDVTHVEKEKINVVPASIPPPPLIFSPPTFDVPVSPQITPIFPEPPISDVELHVSLKYGIPRSGFQTVQKYDNHVLEFDPVRRVPKWVAEHVTRTKAFGDVANRKLARFEPDPNIPLNYTSLNKDFWGSGWSRGHMAPAGNNKHSQEAMNQTFYLTNIVPQDLDNNGNYWNRLEIYCRELTKLYSDVFIISGPLWLPESENLKEDDRLLPVNLIGSSQQDNLPVVNNSVNMEPDIPKEIPKPSVQPRNDRPPRRPKKFVKYEVIGENNVAVPTHLFKIILIEDPELEKPLLASFIIPNRPVQDVLLVDFEVELSEIEKHVGVQFHPNLGNMMWYNIRKSDLSGVDRLCTGEGCRLSSYKLFQEFFWKRRLSSPWNLANLEKDWKEVCKRGLNSQSLNELYCEKKNEFLNKLIPPPVLTPAPTSLFKQETQPGAEEPRSAAAA